MWTGVLDFTKCNMFAFTEGFKRPNSSMGFALEKRTDRRFIPGGNISVLIYLIYICNTIFEVCSTVVGIIITDEYFFMLLVLSILQLVDLSTFQHKRQLGRNMTRGP